MQKVLVTGAAGFIGYHTVLHLLKEEYNVVGLDNINDYYDVNLKYGRLNETGISKESIEWGKIVQSEKFASYKFIKLNLEDGQEINDLFNANQFDYVIHLAAQAGVRYSLINPHAYIDSNIKGFLNILEACRLHPVKHLVYASSSSVYGANIKIPFSESDNVDHPLSLYAATKKANELMAHTYLHLFKIHTTGLRFFTVYGPWGRPDMAPMLFAKAILDDKPINVFNNGDLYRDFTYIDDIVNGVMLVIAKTPEDKSLSRIYNIGCSEPVNLMEFIKTLETALGKKAIFKMMPMQPGDVLQTYADTTRLHHDFGYKPTIKLTEGIEEFVKWFLYSYEK